MKKLILIITVVISSISIVSAQVDSIKLYDIYNFNIGDEFHYKYDDPSMKKDIISVVSDIQLSITSDTVIYSFINHIEKTTYNSNGHIISNSIENENKTFIGLNSYFSIKNTIDSCFVRHDSIYYISDSTFSVLEEEQCKIEKDSIIESNYNQRAAFITDRNYINYNFMDYFNFPIYYSVWQKKIYVLGLGNVLDYVNNYNTYSMYAIVRNVLVYYKKGTEEWGTPLLLSSKNIESETNKKNFTIFPNPATDKITISSEQMANGEVEIYNSLGIKMLEVRGKKLDPSIPQGDSSLEIDIAAFPNGIYVVKIGAETSKFIKE
jgi:hypothetical protein